MENYMANLPYVTAAGNVERALNGIKTAATPPSISQDFVKTILKIPGGSGNQMTAYLRKIGFANTDGTPTELYKSFRNSATQGKAALEALKIAYKPLYMRNEYMHKLGDKELVGLVIEETGESDGSNVVPLIVSCIKAIKKFVNVSEQTAKDAGSDATTSPIPSPQTEQVQSPQLPLQQSQRLRMNLGYTINLNLPATSDVAVFNAIFKSLKEHLLKDSDE
jgi:hypothetical protein